MSLSKDEITHIAKLARLTLSTDDLDHYTFEISKVFDFIDQLQSADIDGVEPLTSVVPATQRLRTDVINDGGMADVIVQNAPQSDDNFFLVPKVVE